VSTICAYRESALATRDEVTEKARRMIARGEDPEGVMRYLAYTLTNKLIHGPCSQMRQAGYQGRNDVIEVAREFFGLRAKKDDVP